MLFSVYQFIQTASFGLRFLSFTFTRLCQGYCESPTIYNEALKNSLESLTLTPTPGSAIIQYMDDRMIAAPSKEQCEKDTIALPCHLAKEGHKASLSKLQFASELFGASDIRTRQNY
ncbi:MAG: reverse transcriptase domain-containing protein [Cetobacterium sp.]